MEALDSLRGCSPLRRAGEPVDGVDTPDNVDPSKRARLGTASMLSISSIPPHRAATSANAALALTGDCGENGATSYKKRTCSNRTNESK